MLVHLKSYETEFKNVTLKRLFDFSNRKIILKNISLTPVIRITSLMYQWEELSP